MSDQLERYPNPSEIRHRIGARGQLTINDVSGAVELRADDGDEVVVIARTQSLRSESLPITVRKTDGSLTIDVDKRGGSFAQFGTWFGLADGMEFQVRVPRAAQVTINTVSADIRSHFLAGEQSYKTVSGDVELNPDGGTLRVVTVSGDIAVQATGRAQLSVNSTSGDVRVGGAVIERFDARTVSGDIDFAAGFAAGPVHTIETVSGDLSIESSTGVTVDVTKSLELRHGGSRAVVAGDGAAQVRFRTLSGDARVRGAREMEDDGRGRHGRPGKHDRFERQLERRIEREVNRRARGLPSDEIDFPGVSNLPPMPPMYPPTDYERSNTPTASQQVDQLEVLRALERGEIDVEEASRRLQEA
jgi:Putative adhesin